MYVCIYLSIYLLSKVAKIVLDKEFLNFPTIIKIKSFEHCVKRRNTSALEAYNTLTVSMSMDDDLLTKQEILVILAMTLYCIKW